MWRRQERRRPRRGSDRRHSRTSQRACAFFTPPEVARYICEWAIRSPADRVYESNRPAGRPTSSSRAWRPLAVRAVARVHDRVVEEPIELRVEPFDVSAGQGGDAIDARRETRARAAREGSDG